MNKFLKSFVYAFNGLSYAFKTQLNFRLHCFATVVVVLLGLYTKLNLVEWLFVTISTAVVMVLELVNTAIEKIVDFISPQQNPKAGVIKDVAAAAVLVASIMAMTVGLIIFASKFI